MADAIELFAVRDHPNVRAFLRMIRHGEGTSDEDGYRRCFGGDLFDSFSDHPRRRITKTLGGRPITSTAAGAYQFLERTWQSLVTQYGFADFSPTNQDLGCIALIRGRGALDDVIAGRFEQAVRKCAKEWASLPGSPYGQPVVTLARARQEYEAHGGTYAQESPAVTPPNPFVTTQEAPMAPFLAAVLPAVIGAVPELVRMFGSGSAVSERNAKAAEVVVAVAKEAIGAHNEQELLEVLQSDPSAAAAVRQAVKEQWFRIEEVGGGIAAAREANLRMQGDRSPAYNPAIWVSAALLIFPIMLLADVFYVHPAAYDANLRTQIVTAVLAVIMMVGGYWLGSSMGSARKDDRREAP